MSIRDMELKYILTDAATHFKDNNDLELILFVIRNAYRAGLNTADADNFRNIRRSKTHDIS